MEIEDIAEKVGTAIGHILYLYMMIALMGDILGVDIWKLASQVVFKPWIIPIEILYQYMWLWKSIETILLGLLFIDYGFYNRYVKKGEAPPVPYARSLAIATFILAFILWLILRTTFLFILLLFSLFATAQLLFLERKK